MIAEETLAQINGNNMSADDPGLIGHNIYEFGRNLWLLEATLRMTPEQRLENHQRMLDLFLSFEGVDEGTTSQRSVFCAEIC